MKPRRVQVKQGLVLLLVGFGALTLSADLMTKAWARSPYFSPAVFIENFFYLTLQSNPGIAFGIKVHPPLQIVVSFILIGLLLYIGIPYLKQQKRKPFLKTILLGIIVGGAVGNLIDRLLIGAVTDFIVLKPFPVFNIADIGITAGLITLFLLGLQDS